jgi:hypothetical protein
MKRSGRLNSVVEFAANPFHVPVAAVVYEAPTHLSQYPSAMRSPPRARQGLGLPAQSPLHTVTQPRLTSITSTGPVQG